ncbi:MAG: carbonic anhydrase [Casimicrobiaceae bacterium]
MCNICGDLQHDPAASRRSFLKAGAALAVTQMVAGTSFAADPPKPGAAPPPNAIAPADALKRIMEGNARYAANNPTERDFSAGRAARSQAQYPIATILGCADSRVVPDLVFDQSPGDLFVCRVAGNIVTTNLLASMEYGYQFLGSPLIMVLGHSSCGAVDAAIKVAVSNAKLPGHLPELIRTIKPSVALAEKMTTGTLLDNTIIENVRQQVARLKTSGPIVQKAYRDKKLEIVGGVYDIATGKITLV